MKFSITLLLITFIFLSSCKDKKLIEQNEKLKEQVKDLKQTVQLYRSSAKNFNFLASHMKNIHAEIITNMGNIELEFFPEKAPITCFNFITRAECGYYDNTKFHRVIKDFMIQGGDPNTKTNNVNTYGQGGPLIPIPHEFNDIKHVPGILSMARPGDVTMGAGSQFFIMHAEYPSLNGQYTAFGKVVNGMDVVDKIANVKTVQPKRLDRPVKPVIVKTIKVFRTK
ncbi:MAG: peptidylprolyl isomerase [Calditrichaceae bacterium]|jgi:cyclophilin family peptidyl-prolyl cis-trans isomerase